MVDSAEFDVVVLGSGAAGLTAALAAATNGASVGVFEKAHVLGGTTALSGGVIWLPDNELARELGIEDSRVEALTYLEALSNGTMDRTMVEAFVDGVDDLTAWLRDRTPVRLQVVRRYPDYHPEHPGGKPGGGRSLENSLTSSTGLGPWRDRLLGDARRFKIGDIPSGGGTGVIPKEVMAERVAGDLEGLGRGLVVALLQGLLDHGVEPVTDARASELVVDDGRVVGVRFGVGEGSSVVRARRGVIIATGGFEFDDRLASSFLRGPIAHPPGAPTNTGDGLRMAMRVGADLGGMAHAWWVPVTVPETRDEGGSLLVRADDSGVKGSALLLRERTIPGSIMVNRDGRRFANEAANYNALGTALHAFDPGRFTWANIPAWVIIDAAAVRRHGCFGSAPGTEPPAWLVRADTIAELAAKIGVAGESLEQTVARWNESVALGVDRDFGRGQSLYDGWCGDQSRYGTPQATLGTLTEGPFYATSVHPSTLGTKGGPRTNVDGAVVDHDGRVIPGLYAAGNAAAPSTGIAYGGAGGTLGPAMVFGFKAGSAAAS